ncbi:MAG: flippase-like domain-containing protein [bacterium]|nr:flippase-like domain-containing protein [bacterium]
MRRPGWGCGGDAPLLSSRRSAGDNAAHPEARLRNALRLTLGIGVSAACLWLATRGTDWAAVGRILAGAELGWLGVGVGIGVTALWLRARRWLLLLAPLGRVAIGPAFSATAIGFMASAVLPLRLGEFVRPALLARRTGLGFAPTLSSVVLERLFDMMLVLFCFLALSLVYPLPEWMARLALLAGMGAAGVLVALVLVQAFRNRVERLVDALLARLPDGPSRRLRPLALEVLGALGSLGSVRSVVAILAMSALVWAANGCSFLICLLALGIDAPLLPAALASLVVVAAAVFLPQGPGFVGTWQYGCVLALGLFHVSEDVAVGYSLLTWVLQMSINVGLGAVCLARENLSLRELAAQQPGEPGLERAP